MNLKGVAVEKDKKANTISICATYEMPEVKGELEIDYLIMPNTGAMKVSQEFDASDDAKVSDLFRFGMLMQLPYAMEQEPVLWSWSYRELFRPQGLHAYWHLQLMMPTTSTSHTSVHRRVEPRAICAGGSRPMLPASD